MGNMTKMRFLYEFEVKYFDHVDWAHKEFTMLAESEEQVRTWADEQRAPEYRTKPYSGTENIDSLTISKIDKPVSFPYIIGER